MSNLEKDMELNKYFKIILSVGIGLISASLLLFLINDNQTNNHKLSKKRAINFSRVANVNKNIMRKAKVSNRVVKSFNNRYLQLSNYPVVSSDLKYYLSSANANQQKYSKIDIQIQEMNNRGYYNGFNRTKKSRMKIYKISNKCKKILQYCNVINSDLILTENKISLLKGNTLINGNLYVKNLDFLKLPKNLYVNGNIYVINSKGLLINENTTVNGNVIVSGISSLRRIVDSIKIAGQVFIKS